MPFDLSPFTPQELLLAGLITLFAGLVQGTLGFGFATICVPILSLINPALVPFPQLLLSLPMTLFMAWRERQAVELSVVGVFMIGRIPGTLSGLGLLMVVSRVTLDAVIAGSVLLAVGMMAGGARVKRTRVNQVLAGYMAGVSGITSGIGGPPVALLYRDASGPTVRANLGAIFAFGIVFSLGVLALSGLLQRSDFLAAACLLPFLTVGIYCSRFLAARVEGAPLRRGILIVASLAGLSLAVKTGIALLG